MKVKVRFCQLCKKMNEIGSKTEHGEDGEMLCRYCGSNNLGPVEKRNIKRKLNGKVTVQ
jgi:hypothetical protein